MKTATKNNPSQSTAKVFVGKVVSDKMTDTIVVVVSQTYKHPVYKKIISKKHKFYATNNLSAKLGDMVSIVETRPISKTKKFKTLAIINKQK